MRRIISIGTLFFTLSLFAGHASAHASDVHSPRTLGLGGSGHAGPLLNDSIYLNPSFAAFLQTYSIALNYLNFKNDGDRKGRGYNVAVQDGRTEFLQAGAAYSVREDGAIAHIGVAKSFFKRFGVSGAYKIYMPTPQAGRPKKLIHDSILSMTLIPLDWLQSSLTVDNLIESTDGKAHQFYREIILGTKFNVQSIVLLYADPHWIPSLTGNTFGHEMGLEFVFTRDFFLRLGNFRNSKVPAVNGYGSGWGLGAGWIAPRISLDYGFSRVTSPHTYSIHSFGTTVYF